MTIEIPPEAIAIARTAARAAGCDDVEQYVIGLIYNSQSSANQPRVGTCDPFYESRVLDGLESGPATPLTADDFQAARKAIMERR